MEGGRRGAGRGDAGGEGSSRKRGSGGSGASTEAILRNELALANARLAEMETQLMTLRGSALYVVKSLAAGNPATPLHNRLLVVPNQMHALVRRGIRRGAIVGVAMAQAATGADLTEVDGFPPDDTLDMQDLVTADAVEALVPVAAIVNGA